MRYGIPILFLLPYPHKAFLPPANEVWGKVMFSEVFSEILYNGQKTPRDNTGQGFPLSPKPPPDRDHLRQRSPWTETCLDRDPQIENSQTETPPETPHGPRLPQTECPLPLQWKNNRYASYWNDILSGNVTGDKTTVNLVNLKVSNYFKQHDILKTIREIPLRELHLQHRSDSM